MVRVRPKDTSRTERLRKLLTDTAVNHGMMQGAHWVAGLLQSRPRGHGLDRAPILSTIFDIKSIIFKTFIQFLKSSSGTVDD